MPNLCKAFCAAFILFTANAAQAGDFDPVEPENGWTDEFRITPMPQTLDKWWAYLWEGYDDVPDQGDIAAAILRGVYGCIDKFELIQPSQFVCDNTGDTDAEMLVRGYWLSIVPTLVPAAPVTASTAGFGGKPKSSPTPMACQPMVKGYNADTMQRTMHQVCTVNGRSYTIDFSFILRGGEMG